MIPKQFHTLWVQGGDPGEPWNRWIESWGRLNPDWEHRVWSEADYIDYVMQDPTAQAYERAINHAQRSEIARWSILYHVGGVVLDADFECLRPWDFLDGVQCFAPFESPAVLTMSVMGSVPGHPAVSDGMRQMPEQILWAERAGLEVNIWGSGPRFIDKMWRRRDDVTLLPHHLFFPYKWDQPDPGSYGEAYAVHHWKATWKN